MKNGCVNFLPSPFYVSVCHGGDTNLRNLLMMVTSEFGQIGMANLILPANQGLYLKGYVGIKQD